MALTESLVKMGNCVTSENDSTLCSVLQRVHEFFKVNQNSLSSGNSEMTLVFSLE
jgi:hypothetical protein